MINLKKIGVVVIRNKRKNICGVFTDGDVKRFLLKKNYNDKLKIKLFMTKNPICVDKDMLAAKALSIMNEKKITSLCVYKNPYKKKIIGIIHIHNLLKANIS